jgi:cyclic pyranopterin phosphate synthase
MTRTAKTDCSSGDLKFLQERIEERITANNTNARAISREADLGDTAVTDILNGKNRSPSVTAVRAIARALNTTIAYLTGEESPSIPEITAKASKLTHLGKRGEARMVDVSAKDTTERVAVAEGRVLMTRPTLDLVLKGDAKKGDVLGAARIAGIMAAKRTHELIPLCHPLPITKVEIEIVPDLKLPGLIVGATVKVKGQTGVEMEALTAVSVACLTIYDMVKAVERGMIIEGIRLVEKRGGKSGHYRAKGE